MNLLYDIETDGLDNATVIHSLVIQDLDTGDILSFCDQPGYDGEILAGLMLLEGADLRVGHNIIDYDEPVIRKLYPKWSPRGHAFDTLVCSRLIYTNLADTDHKLVRSGRFPARLIGSHSLEAWGQRLGYLKGDFGKTTDWKEWSPEMQEYCVRDVKVNRKLFDEIKAKNYSLEAIELEHRFAKVISDMTRHGYGFNEEAGAKLYAELVQKKEEIVSHLRAAVPPKRETLKTPAYWIGFWPERDGEYQFTTKTEAKTVGARDIRPGPMKVKETPFNPLSRVQVASWLISLGWKPTQRTATGQVQIDESTLATVPFEEAKPLAKLFLLQKRIGQLAEGDQAWLKAVRNGRVHCRVNTNGAVTGRCTHHSFNIAQVPRVAVRKDGSLIWGEEGDWGTDCRALFRPATPGWVQVGADASGLELRTLAHYLAAYDGGAYAKIVCEGDVHTSNQEAFGLPSGKDGRGKAKNGIYCLIYGGQNEKLGETLGPLADEHEEASKKVAFPGWAKMAMAKRGPVTPERVRAWKRGAYARDRVEKNIVGLGKLIEDVQAAAQARGSLRGLDGRRLHIRSKHAALNTLLQSAGALLVKKATVIWHAKLREACVPFHLLAHVHDEVQAECREEYVKEVGEGFVAALKQAGAEWNFRCPLTGEYKAGTCWADTH